VTWQALRAFASPQRVAIMATVVVAAGAGVLSWDANTWAAGEIGIDSRFQWIYGIVIDGAIAVGTAAVFVLAGRAQAGAWCVLLGALAISLVGNAAHAKPGSALHTVGSMVPALLLAACLFVLELIARTPAAHADAHAGARTNRSKRTTNRSKRTTNRSKRGAQSEPERRQLRVMHNGVEMSASHARRLRARQRAVQQVASG
jgi:uncharacterized protein DUF2637